jgi:CubicO group peptidase (beta-lactamase class C family)
MRWRNALGALVLLTGVSGCGAQVADGSSATSPASTTTVASTSSADEAPPTRDYWPTEGWRSATPESQGMDSDLLADMLDFVSAHGHEIHSITVIRNGYLVLDVAYQPFLAGERHRVFSCTKSVVASLIGIAIDHGLLNGVDQSVLEVLASSAPPSPGALKASMTIEDLLTMQTGLECRDSYLYGWRGLRELRASDDWTAFALELPMAEEPGTRFEYCNTSSFLLSAIISEVTGSSGFEFARAELFGPLGIADAAWAGNPDGISIGWSDLELIPHDMAKFGFLYLNDGWWDGERVLPEGWVTAATTPHARAGTLDEDYGYQWWVNDDSYSALGYGGQYITVSPELDMVAVFTSGLPEEGFFVPRLLFEDYLAAAVVADEPLDPNPEAVARIDASVAAAATPPLALVPGELPSTADTVSGARFELRPNPAEFAWFELDFTNEDPSLRLDDGDDGLDVTIGLDGVPRVNDAWDGRFGFTGVWPDAETFQIDFRAVNGVEAGVFIFRFEGDGAELVFRNETTGFAQRTLAERVD